MATGGSDTSFSIPTPDPASLYPSLSLPPNLPGMENSHHNLPPSGDRFPRPAPTPTPEAIVKKNMFFPHI